MFKENIGGFDLRTQSLPLIPDTSTTTWSPWCKSSLFVKTVITDCYISKSASDRSLWSDLWFELASGWDPILPRETPEKFWLRDSSIRLCAQDIGAERGKINSRYKMLSRNLFFLKKKFSASEGSTCLYPRRISSPLFDWLLNLLMSEPRSQNPQQQGQWADSSAGRLRSLWRHLLPAWVFWVCRTHPRRLELALSARTHTHTHAHTSFTLKWGGISICSPSFSGWGTSGHRLTYWRSGAGAPFPGDPATRCCHSAWLSATSSPLLLSPARGHPLQKPVPRWGGCSVQKVRLLPTHPLC